MCVRAVWSAAETDGQFVCLAVRCNAVCFVQVNRRRNYININGTGAGDTFGYVFSGVTLNCVYR